MTKQKHVNFVLNHGGIGDYICWLTAIDWTAKYYKHIEIKVYSPYFFIDIAELVFQSYPQVSVHDKKTLTDEEVQATPTYIPSDKATLNCTGANLVDLGFAYYTNRQFAPSYHRNYCQLPIEKIDPLDSTKFNEFMSVMKYKVKYVILTPYYTNENRKMHPNLFNGIKDYLIGNGMIPVLLGQEAWAERRVKMDQEYDFSGCVNLLNKTTLVEAFKIMYHSEMVIGVDNGLLHLAAMSPTPIVFGYTIVGPKYREPRRDQGITINVEPPKELQCRYCLPQMRFHFDHDFNNCIYKDNACVKYIADIPLWIKAINRILELGV